MWLCKTHRYPVDWEYNAQLCEKRPKKFSYQMHFNYQKNNEDGTPDDNWNKANALADNR